MPEDTTTPAAPTSSERYDLSIEIVKRVSVTGKIAHRVLIESNELDLAETIEMQSEIAPALLGFIKKDAPQDSPKS